MYLSTFNSVPEAAEWLSKNTRQPWSWKDVLRIFSQMDPETVSVNIPPTVPLLRLSPGEIEEYKFDKIERFDVCNVQDFLTCILMGDDFESACATPLALVCGSARYRSPISIRASAIRLKKVEIYRLADHSPLESFEQLVRTMQEGGHPELAALVQYGGSAASVPGKATPETEESSLSPVAAITRPLQRTKAQDDAIMAEIQHLNLDPLKLPKHVNGKPGVRATVRKSMMARDAKGYAATFSSLKVYETAWQRLLTAPRKICYE